MIRRPIVKDNRFRIRVSPDIFQKRNITLVYYTDIMTSVFSIVKSIEIYTTFLNLH
tara:strand:+ start:40717 stop:40884 length:168 start_codon:yes stop_codon:yes gene_type:complete